jgi:hypothetical protein
MNKKILAPAICYILAISTIFVFYSIPWGVEYLFIRLVSILFSVVGAFPLWDVYKKNPHDKAAFVMLVTGIVLVVIFVGWIVLGYLNNVVCNPAYNCQ